LKHKPIKEKVPGDSFKGKICGHLVAGKNDFFSSEIKYILNNSRSLSNMNKRRNIIKTKTI